MKIYIYVHLSFISTYFIETSDTKIETWLTNIIWTVNREIDKICELFAYIYVGYYSTILKADFHSDFIKRQVI